MQTPKTEPEKITCTWCDKEKETWEYYWDKKTGKLKYHFCRECFGKKHNARRKEKRNEYAYF